MGRKRNEVGGQRFSRLVVTRYLGKAADFTWECLCDCGQTTNAKSSDLNSGKVQSCGCLNRQTTEERNMKHGHAVRGNTNPVYRVYLGMKRRCYNPRCADYPYYGGRGISICDRWLASFENFLSDMGERPKGHSIERKDNNGNYEPSNCVWATRTVQMRNRRSCRIVTFQGREMSLVEAAEKAGISYDVVSDRVNRLGWTVSEALSKKSIGRWA